MNHIESVRIGALELGSGRPKICVPITGKTTEEIIEQTQKIKEAKPDLAEWRGDLFADIFEESKVQEVLEEIHRILEEIPLLFTFRTKNEGGNRDISIEDYIHLNEQLSKSAYIQLLDVEVYMDFEKMKSLIEAVHKNGKTVIGSHHRFDCTPSAADMLEVLKTIEKAGADILKLAVMPIENSDVEHVFQATNEAVCDHVHHPVVTMSMGALGVRSRICGEIYGSSMTFACVGEASAPGQMEIEELRNAMKNVMSEVKNSVERF